MDKWLDLVIGPKQTMLGLIINTNRLTVVIPPKYLQEVFELRNSTWHPNQHCFKVSEAQKLTGKLACFAKGANWVFHLLSHLYLSIAYAFSKNKRLLTKKSSAEFRDIVLAIQTNAFVTPCKDLAWHTSFAMKHAEKLTYHLSYQYNINRTMRYEIEFFCNKLKPDSGIEWEMPIAHLIPQTPFPMTIRDSLLEGAGGFSITLGFWWHIRFPDEVVWLALQFKTNNDNGMIVLINVLEFVMVIINYCTALHVVWTSPVTDDPHLVILNITDKSSALSWTLHTCKRSKIGQMLAHFFCSLLINLPLGINSRWISTIDNKIADDISCLKKQSDNNSSPAFDYTILKQTYLKLGHCSFFQIQPELILLMWNIVLTKKWPNHKEVQTLKQRPLGKLTT
jgi:hypothetical protein